MKVRSGFKQSKNRNKSFKIVLGYALKKLKKFLSFNLLTLKWLSRLGRKKSRRRKKYLSKDVWKKSYDNPYHKQKKFPSTIIGFVGGNRYVLAQFSLIIIVFIWFIVLFVQPTFYISNIRIEGNEEIRTEDLLTIINDHVNKRSFWLIKRSHHLFLNTPKLEKSIRERYGLESIQFESHWPSHSMLIALKEKVSVLAYSVNDSYYTIDRQGMIIRQLDSLDQIQGSDEVPVIYQYDLNFEPSIGEYILASSNIETVLSLHRQLQKYPSFSIHSYRLRNLAKSEIRIQNKHPNDDELPNTDSDEEYADDLDDLAESIANAQTIEEKIATLRQTLDDIDIERLEEGELSMIYDSESVYLPNDEIQIQELEVYMDQGWSLKLGHEILLENQLIERYLSIFATLNDQVDIEREVKEYVDLRFPNRIYYR